MLKKFQNRTHRTCIHPSNSCHASSSLDAMDPNLGTYFTHSWDILDAYHGCFLYIHDSMIRLEKHIQEPYYLYDHLPIQEDFISELQWPMEGHFIQEIWMMMQADVGEKKKNGEEAEEEEEDEEEKNGEEEEEYEE